MPKIQDFPSRTALPSILVSYVFLKDFLKKRQDRYFRSWVMDSGAFSAYTSGKVIDLNAYTDTCLELIDNDIDLECVFALDVIGDPEASLRNTEKMVEAGVPAIPTFHNGSPWHYLIQMAKDHPRIALGGMALRGKHGPKVHIDKKIDFIEQYFARVWPKWIHGFGCADWRLLAKVPFASADSTSWLYGPARYGRFQMFRTQGQNILPKRGENLSAYNAGIRAQIDWHLGLELDTRRRFGRKLEMHGMGPFQMRLASDGVALLHLQDYAENTNEAHIGDSYTPLQR